MQTYCIWFVNGIRFWFSKAVVFVKHNGSDIRFLTSIGGDEGLGDRDWSVVKSRHGGMR